MYIVLTYLYLYNYKAPCTTQLVYPALLPASWQRRSLSVIICGVHTAGLISFIQVITRNYTCGDQDQVPANLAKVCRGCMYHMYRSTLEHDIFTT